ncbi:hypothetical protein D9M68_537690 [compost metagenome]
MVRKTKFVFLALAQLVVERMQQPAIFFLYLGGDGELVILDHKVGEAFEQFGRSVLTERECEVARPPMPSCRRGPLTCGFLDDHIALLAKRPGISLGQTQAVLMRAPGMVRSAVAGAVRSARRGSTADIRPIMGKPGINRKQNAWGMAAIRECDRSLKTAGQRVQERWSLLFNRWSLWFDLTLTTLRKVTPRVP